MIYTAYTHNDPHELENPNRSQLLPLVSPWQANGWRGSDGLTFSPSLPPSLPTPATISANRPKAGWQQGGRAPSHQARQSPIGSPRAASFPLSSPPRLSPGPLSMAPFPPLSPRLPPLEPSLPLSGSRFAGGARHAARSTPTRRLRTRNKRRHQDEVKMVHTSLPLWFFPSFIYFAPQVILGSLVF